MCACVCGKGGEERGHPAALHHSSAAPLGGIRYILFYTTAVPSHTPVQCGPLNHQRVMRAVYPMQPNMRTHMM